MSQSLVSLHLAVETIGQELVARQQLENMSGRVSVTGVAEAMGAALAVLRARLDEATDDDIVYFFRRGLSGDQA